MLGNKLLNIQFAKYHIWNNKSEGFPNMVLSTETFNQSVRTEYSEAVNVRYTFQPLWVSGNSEFNCAIHWIVIYPVDSVIHLLNNWGLEWQTETDGRFDCNCQLLLANRLGSFSNDDGNGNKNVISKQILIVVIISRLFHAS